MMSVDPKTIIMTNIIGTLLMSLSLFLVSRGYLGKIKGLTKWAQATGLQCLGWFFLSALRGAIPDLISIVVGNGLLLLSLGLYSNILAEFNNKPSRRLLTYLLIGIEAIILAYFVLIEPNVPVRIFIISGGSAFFLFASSYILFSDKGNRPISHLLTGTLFTLCGFILAFRSFYTLTLGFDPHQTPFGTYPMANMSFFTFFIISVMLTFGFVLMCNDRYILERKEVEEKLIIAKKLAEELAGAKGRFLSNMSHEIRTPLNGIIGFTSVLLQSDLPPKEKKQLEIIKTSGNILMALINDILDLAKINEGKVELEESVFNLSDLVNDILISFELRINEKELKMVKLFDQNIPTLLIGDPIRISQILINLINNSIKYTNTGGQITVDVNLLEQDEEKAIIEFNISDTGIGISKEKLKTIFEPFVQANNGSAFKHEGTGLGLGIVKRLTNLMNGTIFIEGKLNEGTTVTVTIPFKKTGTIEQVKKTGTIEQVAEKKETILLSDDLKEIGHLKVLIADDNEINQLLAQTILLKNGFEVDSAENGKIAIDLFNKNQYDIILMDLKMPEMDGFEATQYIRTQMSPPKSTIPIIAITADVTRADLEIFKSAGINDFILKPFDQTDLLNKIISLVKKSKTKT